jgi:SAM-dependent methyltransferase
MLQRYKQTRFYERWKARGKALRRWLAFPSYRGRTVQCPICGAGLRAFKPIGRTFLRNLEKHGFVHPVSAFETLNLNHYQCPGCGAIDRERLYAIYLERRLAELDPRRRHRFVDFAPSPALSSKLRKHPGLDYRTVDLFRADVDEHKDISDLRPWEKDTVDVFLCSHVLEHVPDDRRAMSELCRVLAPGGFGIVMVPLLEGVEDTHEDPAISSPEARCKYYCQGDHLRLYGRRDFAARLVAAGFRVQKLGIEFFGAETFRRHGIAENSVLYVVEKRLAPGGGL